MSKKIFNILAFCVVLFLMIRVFAERNLEIEIAPNLVLDCEEYGTTRKRKDTQLLLAYIEKVLRKANQGLMQECLIEEGSVFCVKDGVDILMVENADNECMSGVISGWINSHGKGCVDIEYLDCFSGDEINNGKRFRTAEYTGWDDSVTNKYYFSTDLTLDGDGKMRNVNIAVQFHFDG